MTIKIAVIGAGGWGTAMAGMLGQKHQDVVLWARNSELVNSLITTRENKRYLPGVILPSTLSYTNNLEEAVLNADFIVIATPSHAVRHTTEQLSKVISRHTIVISAAKGLELGSLKRMSEVIADVIPWGTDRVAAISGPNHAEEVGLKHPSASVVASLCSTAAEKVQDIFITPYFRVYTNPDLIGVEMGGALKNIIALGAGIAEGLGFGDNTKAALMTRGIAEIARLGTAMGATTSTFAGLSGIGDLMVTCASRHSRNRRAGILLAQGKTINQIEAESNMVVEGIRATLAARQLAEKYKIDMPIVEQTYQVMYENKPPKEAVYELMARGRTHEVEEVAINCSNWKF